MKKILFPFFKSSKHGFLLDQWWFRLLIVVYIIAIIIIPLMIFVGYMQDNSCHNSTFSLYPYGSPAYKEELARCQELTRKSWLPAIVYGVLGTLILHYLVQATLFKILIDYIVLGGKNRYQVDIK